VSVQLHPLVSALLVLLVVALLLFLFSPFLAERLLFLPPGIDPGEAPRLDGVDGESVTLNTDDGVQVHGWWYEAAAEGGGVPDGADPEGREAAEPAPAVLVLHGNAGSIAGRVDLAEGYLRSGISVLLLSYRGYGRSEGRPSLDGVRKDTRAGLDFLAEATGGLHRVVVHGRSLGGAVALSALKPGGPEPAGMILESSFTSLDRIARAVYPFIPSPLLFRIRGLLDAEGRVADFEGPVFVIHGGADRIVPPEMGRRLYDAARNPRDLWIVDGAGHNDLEWVAGDEHRTRVTDFVLEVTGSGR